MQTFVVPDFDSDLDYLRRLRIVQTPWFGVYLHRIGTPDSRPTLHDHPWNFLSIVVRGGYTEMTGDGCCYAEERHVRWVNHKRAEYLHYIMRLDRTPTWTLVFVGRRRREWGYAEGGQWTRFDQHPHAVEFDAAMARRAS